MEAGETGRGVGAPAEEVKDRGCSAGPSLEGSRVVADDRLEQEPSWAIDVVGGQPTPKALFANGDRQLWHLPASGLLCLGVGANPGNSA